MSAYSADWFTGRPTGNKGLRAFYLGRAVRAYLYRGKRHGVMYTGDGKKKSGNQKAIPNRGLSN